MQTQLDTSRLCALAALLGVFLLPQPSEAAQAPEGNKPQGPVDVELPAILAPIVIANRLENYAYIVIALAPTGPDKVFTIREKVPFLQDAFLRELNKGSISKVDDPKAVDTDTIKTRLLARMNQILPAGTVADLKFEQITLTPVQPPS